MASIEVLKDGTGTTRGWKVRWRDDSGARSESFLVADGRKEKEAKAYRAGVEHDQATGRYIDDRRGQETVEVYGKRWLATLPHSTRTAKTVESWFKNHVFPTLGPYRMANVRHSTIAGLVAEQQRALEPLTARNLRTYVWRMFADAVADEVIRSSPCYAVAKPKVARGPDKEAMSVDELDRLRARLPERWRDIVTVGIKSGMRNSELRGLCVDQVDFFGRNINVDRQLLPEGFLPPKHGSFRTVMVDQATLDVIAAHLARWGEGPDRLVFTNSWGQPLSYDALGNGWRQAAARANVRGTVPHDMRHHYASVLIGQAVPLPTISKQLGHADPSITARVYSHVIRGQEEQQRKAIEAALAAARVLDVSCEPAAEGLKAL